MISNILVVCAGNICRSPMGEAFFKQLLPSEVHVDSAGIVGLPSHPADDKAIQCMLSEGIDISEHQSKKITPELIKENDLILVMTQNQLYDVEQQWPFSKGKVFKIGQWLNKDVPDPYKKDETAFIYAMELIKESTNSWLDKL